MATTRRHRPARGARRWRACNGASGVEAAPARARILVIGWAIASSAHLHTGAGRGSHRRHSIGRATPAQRARTHRMSHRSTPQTLLGAGRAIEVGGVDDPSSSVRWSSSSASHSGRHATRAGDRASCIHGSTVLCALVMRPWLALMLLLPPSSAHTFRGGGGGGGGGRWRVTPTGGGRGCRDAPRDESSTCSVPPPSSHGGGGSSEASTISFGVSPKDEAGLARSCCRCSAQQERELPVGC